MAESETSRTSDEPRNPLRPITPGFHTVRIVLAHLRKQALDLVLQTEDGVNRAALKVPASSPVFTRLLAQAGVPLQGRVKLPRDPEELARLAANLKTLLEGREARVELHPGAEQQVAIRRVLDPAEPEPEPLPLSPGRSLGGSRQRWRCGGCGRVSTAPSLGMHQRASGHEGRERIE